MVTAKELMNDRQALILDEKMGRVKALVAGAGMVGSWAAMALVRAVDEVHVWDDDTIEHVNVGVQAYDGGSVGLNKAAALAALCTDPPVVGYPVRFPNPDADDILRFTDPEDVVVVCGVDSMAGRRAIAEWSRDNGVGLFIETGVHAELVVVKTVTTPDGYERFLRELPSDDEVEDPMCGLKGTAYAGMSLASQIVPLVNQWCRGDALPERRLFHTGYFMPMDTGKGGDDPTTE